MFRQSNKESQIYFFVGIPAMLEGKSKKQYNDISGWHTSDTEFVLQAIETTTQVTGHAIGKGYAAGVYQSPKNDPFCEDLDVVYTGIQGNETIYQHDLHAEELYVTDIVKGEIILVSPIIKTKRSTKDKWSIKTEKGYRHFDRKQIRTSLLRTKLQQRLIEELRKRNNVEATMFHLSCTLRNNKTKYRGIFKQQMWPIRGLWINLIRMIHFIQQTCQRTFQTLKNQANYHFFRLTILAMNDLKLKINLNIIFIRFHKIYLFLKYFLHGMGSHFIF